VAPAYRENRRGGEKLRSLHPKNFEVLKVNCSDSAREIARVRKAEDESA
jgi:hypothetical protein